MHSHYYIIARAIWFDSTLMNILIMMTWSGHCNKKEAHQLTTMLTFRGRHRIRHPHTPTSLVSFSLLPGSVCKKILHNPLETQCANSALGLIDLIHSLPFEIIVTCDTHVSAVLWCGPRNRSTLSEAHLYVHSPHTHKHTHTNQFLPIKFVARLVTFHLLLGG